MRNLTRILLCLALTMTAATACLAQQGKRARPAKRKRAPAPMRQEVIVVAPTVVDDTPTEETQVGQATVRYHPRRNRTSVGGEFPEVYRRPPVSVSFHCSFGWDDRSPTRPDTVQWLFFSDWVVFKTGDRLTVVADGKRFSFTPQDNGLQNQRFVEMDFASFEQIANDRQVSVKFGQVVFDFDEGQREAFRDMLRTLEPAGKKP
jgi:hypothetical protein